MYTAYELHAKYIDVELQQALHRVARTYILHIECDIPHLGRACQSSTEVHHN